MFKFVLLIILIIPIYIFAQSAAIKGVVSSSESGEHLAGVNIFVQELKSGTSTDKDGFYSIKVPQSGEYTLTAAYVGYAQTQVKVNTASEKDVIVNLELIPEILKTERILITATRAKERETPVTFTNLSRDDLQRSYTASDVPLMLNTLPNVHSYSLTGDELGYSFLKIRGFDQKRIGVMINDIPLNDPEDQEVYWVDMPDFGESIQDIQVQRGVGSSTYGAHTFGGSVNINTSHFSGERSISVQYGFGSYDTRKFSAQFKSGLIDGKYAFYSRFSKVTSSSFRDNSDSDLWAYYFGAARFDENTVTKINVYGGQEITHPDWYGIPQDILKINRTYNSSTYKNDVDNFKQPHYELINEWKISDRLQWKNTFFYIRGEGYYENLKTNTKLTDFGMNYFATMDPGLFGADSLDYYAVNDEETHLAKENGFYTVKRTDLVRQKWVKKNQYGAISQLNIKTDDSESVFGFSGYLFDSRHFGKVIWAKHLPAEYDPDREYHNYSGDKKAASIFYNNLHNYSDKLKLFTNILFEHKTYTFEQKTAALFQGDLLNTYTVDYNFLSPRLGVNYLLDDNINIYGNVSFAQREPADNELYDTWQGPDDLGVPPLFAKNDTVRKGGSVQKIEWSKPFVKPEKLVDFELGINYRSPILAASLNFYWMDFRNEILPYGGLDKDGGPIKGNADRTIHRGIELSADSRLSSFLSISANIAYSQNYFNKFIQNDLDWNTWQTVKTDLSGNTIAGFPDLIGNLKVDVNYQRFFTSLSARHVGKQYLDNTENKNRIIDAYTTFNAIFRYKLPQMLSLPKFEFVLNVINLLDTEYETAGYYDSWAGSSYYWPAAGRHFYAAIKVEL